MYLRSSTATTATATATKRKSITTDPSSFFEPFAKKAKRDALGDVTAKYTSQELDSFEKGDLVTHVLALQDYVTKLSDTQSAEKSHDALSPEQIDEKVDVTRRMLIAGLKAQMKVSPSYPDDNSNVFSLVCKSMGFFKVANV